MTVPFNPKCLKSLQLPQITNIGIKSLGSFSIVVGIILGSNASFALPSANVIQTNADNTNKNVAYSPPPDAGTPKPTGGTGSRGGCLYESERPSLASLVGQPHLMLTTSERPVLWIYVPYSPTEAPTGTFSLQQGDNELYRGDFNLAATPGVVGISLPDTSPSLVAGQDYEWFIDLHCTVAIDDGTNVEPDPAILEGFIQRVPISDALSTELANAQSGLDTVAAYGNHHIWYDLLTELARLRLETGPNPELNTVWTDLLSDPNSVLLETWATETLVEEVIAGE
ncbi:MAG: DUF928 domain-containing protein [Cyanobacteria bacterium P01_B01_bin.77]